MRSPNDSHRRKPATGHESLNAWPEPDSDLDRRLDDLLANTGAEAAELFLRDPTGDRLWLAAHRGIGAREFQERVEFRIGEGFPGLVAETGESILTVDLAIDPRYLRAGPKRYGFRYYLCVPVFVGEQVAGSLAIASRSRRETVIDQESQLTRVAQSLADIVELGQLRSKEAVSGSPADPELDAKQNLQNKLTRALQSMVDFTGAEGGIVLLRDIESGALHPWCWHGAYESACSAVSGSDPRACACSVITQRRGIVMPADSSGTPRPCRVAPSRFARVACLPLATDEVMLGAISLGYGDRRAPPGRLLDVLGSMAQRLAQEVADARAAIAGEERAIAARDLRLMGELDEIVERSLRPVTLRFGRTEGAADVGPDDLRTGLREAETLLQSSVREIATVLDSAPAGDAHAVGSDEAAGYGSLPFLDLRCFGRLAVFRGGQRINPAHFERRRAWTLLEILLANYGKTVHREVLIDLLWPDGPPPGATKQLKVLVHDLRRTLAPEPPRTASNRFVVWDGRGYAFDVASPHRLDSREFISLTRWGERLAQLGDMDSALLAYRAAASLYTGDFLEDELYSDWCAAERDHLRESFLMLLRRTATLQLARGDIDQAISCYRRMLRMEPVLEDVHRELMRLLWQGGQRDDALRQYRTCADVLREIGGRTPQRETIELLDQIEQAGPGSAEEPVP